MLLEAGFTAGATRDLAPYMGRDPPVPPRGSSPYVASSRRLLCPQESDPDKNSEYAMIRMDRILFVYPH